MNLENYLQKLINFFKTSWKDLFPNKRKLTGLVVVILLLVVLPVSIYLATHPQIFKPKAAPSSENIKLYNKDGTAATVSPGFTGDVLMVIKDTSWK